MANVKQNLLEDHHCLMIRLPQREGGLGVQMYTPILQQCYDASMAGLKMSSTSKVEVESLSEQLKQHLRACRKPAASLWLMAGSPFPHFAQALQTRLRLFGLGGGNGSKKWGCDCGVVAKEQDFVSHVLGCAKLRGTNVHCRHNAIRDCLARFCRNNSIACSIEPLAGELGKRCDLRIATPTADIYVDFVVVNGQAKTHAGKSLSLLEVEKDQAKCAKYEDLVRNLGGQLLTFVVEVNGGLASEARKLTFNLEKLACISDKQRAMSKNTLAREISTTLQRWNGAIVYNALRVG